MPTRRGDRALIAASIDRWSSSTIPMSSLSIRRAPRPRRAHWSRTD